MPTLLSKRCACGRALWLTRSTRYCTHCDRGCTLPVCGECRRAAVKHT